MPTVRCGWNTEWAREKFDVTLDETDLARMLADAGLPADTTVTLNEALELLYLKAEAYGRITLMRQVPSMRQQLTVEVEELNAKRAAIMQTVRERQSA